MDPDLVSWVVLDETGQPGQVYLGSLDEAQEFAPGNKVTVLVPSIHIVLTSASVPTQNRQRLAKALPYILEDQLADDIDDLHFALGVKRDDGTMHCAVVRKDLLEYWLEQLHKFHVSAHVILPDILALPMAPNEWSLVREDGRYLLRTGEESGYSVESDMLLDTLQLLLASRDDALPLTCLNVFDLTALHDPLPDLAALDINVVQEVVDADPLVWLSQFVPEKPALNLLQGVYSRRERMGKMWRPWLPTAAMLAGVIVLQLVTGIVDYYRFKSQAQALNDEVVSLYLAAYPGTKAAPVTMLEKHMTNKLKALKGGGSVAGGLLGMLANSGPVFSQTPGVTLRNVRYRDGKLEVNLDIDNLQILDKLKQQLSDTGGVTVDILSANAKGDKVESRLQLTERSS